MMLKVEFCFLHARGCRVVDKVLGGDLLGLLKLRGLLQYRAPFTLILD